MTDEKLKELLNDMSLDEKIGQMVQLTGVFFDGEGLATGPMMDMNLTEYQVKNTGSILSTVGAKKIKDIQDKYMKNQPHHIPMVFMADVINGYRTVFPIPLAQGCSFNPKLVKDMAKVAAKESARAGLHVTFSPMVDLVKDARWGRVMESTGEDAYLNGLYAKAMVEGYQGDGIKEKDKISACIKHFAGYGAPVAGRDYNQVELSYRTLMDEYMGAYKEGVKANSRMFMTSFNTLDRIPSTGNKKLMRDILRDEWGFDGILISDWAAISELIPHGVAVDAKAAAKMAVEAGVDIDMMTNCYANNLKSLYEEGSISLDLIDECVYRILRFKNELGLFENPYKDADEAYDTMDEIDKEHISLARRALPETFVLLKNEDDILPLSKKADDKCSKIAFIGPYIDEKNVCGSWSLFYNLEENVTIKDALISNDIDVPYSISKGCTVLDANQHWLGFSGPVHNDVSEAEMEKMMLDAVKEAKESDVVVMAIGEHFQMTGEGGSKTNIEIPAHQLKLFDMIYEVNKNIIVVNFSGRPLDIRHINDKAKAILQVWFPGTMTGPAIVDVLFGDANPSGRLSMSFPYSVGQLPISYSELHTGRIFEDPNNRFSSRYLDTPNKPLYVFGYGLDYTTYEYSNLRLSKNVLSDDEPILLSVDVKNTGTKDGCEVVQMYIQDLVGSVARPLRQLKGISKIKIKANETVTVNFTIDTEMLKFYDINMDYVIEKGEFKVYVGANSDATLSTGFIY